MCKIFTLTNASQVNRNSLEKLLKTAAKVLTPSDKDGFGWSAMGVKEVFGERYLGVKHVKLPLLTGESATPKPFRSLFKSGAFEKWGKVSEIKGSLIVHARFSTNSIALENSHPHRNETHTLVHNGVVNNEGETYQMQSTCDTEHLLHHLSSKGVHGMVKNVSGYYAVCAIEHDTGNLILIKDKKANLHGCYIESIDSLAFSTSAEHLKTILKTMKWKHTPIEAVTDNIACVFDRQGTLLSQETITPNETVAKVYSSEFETQYYETADSFDTVTRFEDDYTILNQDGETLTYAEYETLSTIEKNLCDVIDARTGRPVELSA